MQPNRRTARVRELLKHQVAECIRQGLTIDEVGVLTVNDVGVSSDLRSATVFLGFVGTAEQRRKAPLKLQERAKLIRMQVGSAVRLKYTPELKFQIDDSIAEGNKVLAIIEQLEATTPSLRPVPVVKPDETRK
jgi:ribosome-binding factor A